jgi:glycosyltransferase involved in cell wall biosynthesis
MRIAMLGQKGLPATYGGVERHVEELGAHLVARGHAVTAYCRRHYTPADTTSLRGIRLKVLPSVPTKHLDAITGTAAAMAHVLSEGWDVVHVHAIGPALLSWLPRLLLGGRSAVVATVHGLDWRRAKWGPWARWCLKRGERAAVRFPHRTIVVSAELRRYFAERGFDTVHIPNGVEAADPKPLEALRPLGVEEGNYILWLGRFVPEKRVEDLIAAFKRWESDRRLLLCGELDARDPYVRRVREEAGDDARILFPGGLYGEAKREALTHAAALVQPSELEGFPIALLEGMRYGLPVIASAIPAHLEAAAPDETARTFQVGDVAGLAEQLRWLEAHPAEASAMGARAAVASEAYDWRLVAEETEAVYAEARALL